MPSLSISAKDGSIHIEECALVITKGLVRDVAADKLSQFYVSNIDHKNGYEWLRFNGVSYGGQPCGFSLCFLHGEMAIMNFGVSLPNMKLEDGWPTRETIDQEISFVRKEMAKQLGRTFQYGPERFSWGVAWSSFDAKGVCASAGLRYET